MGNSNNILREVKNMVECKTCSGPTEGFKCDGCGEESAELDESHSCGAEHCMPKCTGCGEAEVKCSCKQSESSEATESTESSEGEEKTED